MNCIILAGGMGTRLKSVVSDRPKPLAKIDGVPFLDILLEQLSSCSLINKVVLATGYMNEQIKEYYEHKTYPFTLLFSNESQPLGTGGAVKNALAEIHSEDILIMNGDSFLDINFDEFIKFHVHNASIITIASTYVADETRYGFLKLSEDSDIIDFQEKPLTPQSGWINCGIYIVKMNLIKENKHNGAFSLEKDFFPFYLGNKTQAFKVEGKFIDIGTPESYKLAQSILSKN